MENVNIVTRDGWNGTLLCKPINIMQRGIAKTIGFVEYTTPGGLTQHEIFELFEENGEWATAVSLSLNIVLENMADETMIDLMDEDAFWRCLREVANEVSEVPLAAIDAAEDAPSVGCSGAFYPRQYVATHNAWEDATMRIDASGMGGKIIRRAGYAYLYEYTNTGDLSSVAYTAEEIAAKR